MDSWWTALDEYLEMPNPYIPEGIPGHERWMDSFPEFVMNQTSAPDGHWYQVSLDWVETALFYNVAMFEEAGVEADWANWGDFIADMKTLQDTLGVAASWRFSRGDRLVELALGGQHFFQRRLGRHEHRILHGQIQRAVFWPGLAGFCLTMAGDERRGGRQSGD